jgi:uncharacterized protein YaaQ
MAAQPTATGTAMRLVIASIQDYDAAALLRDLSARGWGATQIASTGGALRSGATTLLIGVPATQVRQVLRLIEEHCGRSTELLPLEQGNDEDTWYPPPPVAAELGGASVSVLKVVRFERL